MTVENKLSAIIIGAGYAGLAAAIELARNGIKVRVFESVSKLTNQGTLIPYNFYKFIT
jgi:2-polyprenyl-6-methoxyphenol hydroxylase-like FAD-dependent oxidoreductase